MFVVGQPLCRRLVVPTIGLGRSYATSSAVSSVPPLTVPWVSNITSSSSTSNVASVVSSSTLANGIRVITRTENASRLSTIGIFVRAGSRYETDETRGITALIERLAFTGGDKRSFFRTVRESDEAGVNLSASASRENIMYRAVGLRSNISLMTDILAESILSPKLFDWDVEEQIGMAKDDIDASMASSHVGTHRHLIACAYDYQTLGRGVLSGDDFSTSLSGSAVRSFMNARYKANDMVIVAAGVDHANFVTIAEKSFGAVAKGGATKESPAKYFGGFSTRISSGVASTNVAIAFEGVPLLSNDYAACLVLESLLGGGVNPLSVGSGAGLDLYAWLPGKGITSRLHRSILKGNDQILFAHAMNHSFSDSGVFAICGAATPCNARHLGTSMYAAMQDVASGKAISDSEVSKAKATATLARTDVHESQWEWSHNTANKHLAFGNNAAASTLPCVQTEISKVSLSDIQRLAAAMIQKPLTVVAEGSAYSLPHIVPAKL